MSPPVTGTAGPQRRAGHDRSATRDRLVDATRRVIETDGLAAATSRRITTEAGTNLASITYWFGSKQALVDVALRAELELLVEPALQVLESTGDPGARAMEAIGELLRTFTDRRDATTAYLAALVGAARAGRGGDDRPDATRDVVVRIRRRLASVNAALVAAGSVPGWVDPDAMASLVVAAANGIALQAAIEPDGPTAEAQAGQLALLLLAARGTAPTDGVDP